ncbi:MAG: lipoyl(octanoyl) transferase LipB [Terrimicrobiaceae bacterium]
MSIEVQVLGTVNYEDALRIQNKAVDDLIAGIGNEKLLLLEHEPVYTIGRTRDQSSLLDRELLPFPVVETNRGGQATYHGPGQLVGYPVLDLNRRGRDLHIYLRRLEEVLIALCGEWEVAAWRRDGLTGVWVGEKKIASLGVGVRKWVTMHGFALNVLESSLAPFSNISPCGLPGVVMTSLEGEGAALSGMDAVRARAATLFLQAFADLKIN